MSTPRRILVLHALGLALATEGSAQAFATGTLAELRERATSNGAALVVDFSSDTIEPCRRLLATTWQDATLWQWLGKNAMAARIDPELVPAAVQSLALTAYPTIVVYGKDGAELDRIVGYVDAKTLQERLAKRIHAFSTNYREREKIADQLRKQGDLDGALEHYLWLWDHGEEHNQSFHGVRGSFFLNKLAAFAKTHAPARLALEQRRDALHQSVVGGEVEYKQVNDLVNLAKALATPDLLVDVLDKVPADKWARERVAHSVLLRAALAPLLKARRYQDAVRAIGDPERFLEGQLGVFNMPQMPERIRAQMLDRTIGEQAEVIEALFGARDERVGAVVGRVLELHGGVKTWLMVLKAAKRSGNDVACHDHAVRALQELPEADHEKIREFLQRK